jgi:CheY-like chemotaxis protein
VKQAIGVCELLIEEKQHSLEVVIDPTIPTYVHADEKHLIQVLTNLLSNAVKFTPPGGYINLVMRSLSCDLKTHEHIVEISVSDTGIGIAPEQLTQLFQPFQQVDNSASRSFGGIGLGLSISKNIVEMMGGTIFAISEVDVGTTVTFTVRLGEPKQPPEPEVTPAVAPVVTSAAVGLATDALGADTSAPDAQEADASATDAPATDASDGDADFSNYRILLVEDVDVNREIAMALLEPTQIAIDCAINGLEAVSMFESANGGYDLILMDIQMPELDGYGATQRIRALEAQNGSKRTPIAAMTANVFQDDIDRSYSVGMDDHIGKPIDVKKLLACLNRFLGNH